MVDWREGIPERALERFAGLESDEAFRAFEEEYGPLLEVEDEFDWREEVVRMRTAMEALSAFRSARAYEAGEGCEPSPVLLALLTHLAAAIEAGLGPDRVELRAVVDRSLLGVRTRFSPTCLLGALWLLLAERAAS
jgi:hypothetical protein